MKSGTLLAAVGLTLLVQTPASATTIDFNSAVEPGPGISTIVIGSVSITRINNFDLWLGQPSPNGTRALLGVNDAGNTPGSEWVATFASPVMNVSIDLGDFGVDADTIYLTAFNASNSQIGAVSQVLPASFSGMVTLSLAISGVKTIRFGTSGGIGGIYADNLTFSPVPIPAMLPIFAAAIGFLGLAGWRMRRRALATA